MKKNIKLITLALAILLALSVLAACGGGEKPVQTDAPDVTDGPASTGPEDTEPDTTAEPEVKEITGESTSVEGYSVLVPDGYQLKMPGEFSPYDFQVGKGDFSYFDFNVKAEDDSMMQHYNYNKQTYTNEQKDVLATYGENEWTGFQYSDGFGGYGFEAYTTINGKVVRVSSAGFAFDSPEAAAVLASLKAE